MLHDALALADSGPVAVRYARGAAVQVTEHEVGSGLHARRIRAGDGSVCILAIGKMVQAAQKAVDTLVASGVEASLWDVRCCAPIDTEMIVDAAKHSLVITCEDGIREGGIGMSIADDVHSLDSKTSVVVLGVPTKFIPQGKAERIHAQLGLDADGIVASVRAHLRPLSVS